MLIMQNAGVPALFLFAIQHTFFTGRYGGNEIIPSGYKIFNQFGKVEQQGRNYRWRSRVVSKCIYLVLSRSLRLPHRFSGTVSKGWARRVRNPGGFQTLGWAVEFKDGKVISLSPRGKYYKRRPLLSAVSTVRPSWNKSRLTRLYQSRDRKPSACSARK